VAAHYRATIPWKVTVKVKNQSCQPNDVRTDTQNLMNVAIQKQFADSAAKRNLPDYQLISSITTVDSTSSIYHKNVSKAGLIIADLFPVWEWACDVKGTTIIDFYDDPAITLLLVGEVIGLMALAIAAIIVTVSTGGTVAPFTIPAFIAIIGLIGIAIAATSVVDVVQAVSTGVVQATSNPASAFVTIVIVIVGAIIVIGLTVVILFPKTREWIKNRIPKLSHRKY